MSGSIDFKASGEGVTNPINPKKKTGMEHNIQRRLITDNRMIHSDIL